jgi:hypothetical protein
MSTRPPSRVPWILFQGLVLGLPAAGLILLTTWVLRYAGLVIPWSPALGLSIGVMTGSLSLAAFQTFDHAPPTNRPRPSRATKVQRARSRHRCSRA